VAFTESQRVAIRLYMCWPQNSTDPDYNAQITRAQSTADGGNMTDSSLETRIGTTLTNLATIEARLATQWDTMAGAKVDKLEADPVRATLELRAEGRRQVRQLAMMLEASPHDDIFLPTVRFRGR
jgi:hypothetical protein